MDFLTPQPNEITIYSKSGCPNCLKTKQLLTKYNLNYKIINCDEYLLENKGDFLQFIEKLAGKEYKIFPMVFDNKIFIGGFNETETYVDELLTFNATF